MEYPAMKAESKHRLAKGKTLPKPSVLSRRSLQKPDRATRDLDFAAA